MMLELLIVTFLIGVVAAIIAGMLGGGVGLFVIPVLIWVLQAEHVSNQLLMHIAVATNSAAFIFIGLIAMLRHHRVGTISWPLLKFMLPVVMAALVVASLIAKYLPSSILMIVFACIVLILAVYTWWAQAEIDDIQPKRGVLIAMGLFIGTAGGLIGANAFSVPFLRKVGYNIRVAIGCAIVIGTSMSVGVAVVYTLTGWSAKGLPMWSTGYVQWLLVIPIAIAGLFFTRLGARLAARIPKKILSRTYAVLLVVIAAKMLISGIVML